MLARRDSARGHDPTREVRELLGNETKGKDQERC